jgi:hypothetical protein
MALARRFGPKFGKSVPTEQRRLRDGKRVSAPKKDRRGFLRSSLSKEDERNLGEPTGRSGCRIIFLRPSVTPSAAMPGHPADRGLVRVTPRVFGPAAQTAPGQCMDIVPQRTEGAGKAGRPMRPQPRMQKWKAYEQVTTGSPDRSGLPCAMVLTVSFVISPVTGLSCHRRQRDARHRRQFDASVGASGPHDFAVREVSAFVSRATRVHRIPRPTFVTIAIRPSETRRDGWNR